MTSTHVPIKEVHRPLALVSPLMQGEDVHQLQLGLDSLLDHYKIDWLPLHADGVLGPQTLHAARFLTWVIGLGKGHREPIQKRHVITQATQRLLRSPEHRSRVERTRAKRRSRRLAKIRHRQESGTAGTVAYARACVGITESPAGSNRGPDRFVEVDGKRVPAGVSMFQLKFGLDGVYWCLCFASFSAIEHGGAKISGNVAYSVAIESYARLHENGFVQVRLEDARPGDFTIWGFDGASAPSDHGELVVEVANGPKEDVGGNTSSEGGSQSNGGGVFAKQLGSSTRPLADLRMVVRPLYG